MPGHDFTEPTPTSRFGETVLPVWIEHWEIECCAPPPAVGALSTWWLFFIPGGRGSDPELARGWSCTATPLVLAGRPDPFGVVLDIAGAAVFWHPDHLDGGRVPVGPVEIRGHLAGTAHGGSVPEEVGQTTGMVRRLRVANQMFAHIPGRPWQLLPGTLTLIDEARSPRWFRRGHSEPGDEPRGQEIGVLLDFAVTTGQASRAGSEPRVVTP